MSSLHRECVREKKGERERYRKTEREGEKRMSDRKRKIEGIEDRKRETGREGGRRRKRKCLIE